MEGNGMLLHAFLRVGEDISFQHFIVFGLFVCLSCLLLPACPPDVGVLFLSSVTIVSQ